MGSHPSLPLRLLYTVELKTQLLSPSYSVSNRIIRTARSNPHSLARLTRRPPVLGYSRKNSFTSGPRVRLTQKISLSRLATSPSSAFHQSTNFCQQRAPDSRGRGISCRRSLESLPRSTASTAFDPNSSTTRAQCQRCRREPAVPVARMRRAQPICRSSLRARLRTSCWSQVDQQPQLDLRLGSVPYHHRQT